MSDTVRKSLGLLLLALIILPVAFTDGGDAIAAQVALIFVFLCGGVGILGLLYEAFRPRPRGPKF